MQTFEGLESYVAPRGGIVLTIGNFDGVHVGHQRILTEAAEACPRLGVATVAAMTFEPHPWTVLAPHRAPARLTNAEDKRRLLAWQGVGALIVMKSEPSLFALSAEAFLARVAERCRPRMIVEGASFRFGRGREGDAATLAEAGRRHGFETRVVEPQMCSDAGGASVVSSSAIRQALLDGRVEIASEMLGRPHAITGFVARGAGRGARIGIPTANLEGIEQVCPAAGVYVAVAWIDEERPRLAAVNIGAQPTFEDDQQRVEAHVLDLDEDVRGKRMRLAFIAGLRPQRKFGSADELVKQIRTDLALVRAHEPGTSLEKLDRVWRAPTTAEAVS